MKIHIIGCSGSGKTYLAKALSTKYNIPHFDLDDIHCDNNADGYGVKMREPYQILSIPYRVVDGTPLFCVFRRADSSYWQFIAGGGENGETPIEAAKRETIEEISIDPKNIKQLTCVAYIPAEVIAENRRKHWDKNTFVIPEYTFVFECDSDLTLSKEHSEYKWLTYDEARKLLKWDSNKVAMYEVKCRLENKK